MQWKDDTKPGIAAGVVNNGKVTYLKGFGSTDIENNIKITPQTKFQVDDLAKQFTVLSVLKLIEDEKLSLEDDIRQYITNLPKYTYTIKVKHLLNHSSGLHNLDPIKELLGIQSYDVFTQEHALKLITSQKVLNFKPGTAFSYHRSDTEIILLSEIVAKASGQSFKSYTKQHIFKPLGMTNTAFDNERERLRNTAKSYQVAEHIYDHPINDLTLGATNLYTTAEDLANWFLNYSKPSSSVGQLVKTLDTYVTLDNGKTAASSWGILTYGRYYDHLERGLESIWQFGLINGYGSNIFRFHTKNFVSFVLGNNNRYNGMPAMTMAYKELADDFPKPESVDIATAKIKKRSIENFKTFEGFYWNPANGLAREIVVKNDTLRYKRLENNRETTLLPIGENTFQFVVDSDDEITIEFSSDQFSIISGVSHSKVYNAYLPIKVSEIELTNYAGLYYNEELDITYTFYVEDHKLMAKNLKNGTTEFFSIIDDTFRSNTFMLSGITFKRNNQKEINGFAINTDGISNLFFKKLT